MNSYDIFNYFNKQLNNNIHNMSKEDINRYEIFLKDLYLKSFYDNTILGPMQNNIFISKPWINNYRNIPFKCLDLFSTLYNNFKDTISNETEEKNIFVSSQGNFSNKELLDMTDKFASGLQKKGIDVNDNICLIANCSIEEPVSLLAASKIGACAMYLDFTKSIDDLKTYIDACSPKIIMIDELFLGMEPYINTNKLPVIILNSKKKYSNDHYFSFEEILKLGNSKEINEPNQKFDRPVAVIFSSGTTGKAKPIVHNNYSINMAAQKMLYTDYEFGNNTIMLETVPPHIGLGLITTLYTSLISNTKIYFIQAPGPKESVIMTTDFIKKFPKFIKDNNLNSNTKLTIFSAPMFYRAICNFLNDANDLSFINGMLAAGSKMSTDELKMMESFFKSKNCNIKVCNAYGQNENAGAISSNTNKSNIYGSGGFPVIGTTVRIINNNNEFLDINEEGEIIVQTPSQFIEYQNMKEMTSKQMIRLSDGKEYFKTNDIGYIDKLGYLWITGRKTRVMIIEDCKVSVDLVENKIRMSKYVKDCAILPLKINKTDMDSPILFLVLKEKYKNIIKWEDINNELEKSIYKLNQLEIPSDIIYLNDIPTLSSGKTDYLMLEEIINKRKNVKKLTLKKD